MQNATITEDSDLIGAVVTGTENGTFKLDGNVSQTNLDNISEYSGTSRGITVGSSVSMGFGEDSDKQTSQTIAGIGVSGNTANGLTNNFDAQKVKENIEAQVGTTKLIAQTLPKFVADEMDQKARKLRAEGKTEEAKMYEEGGILRAAVHAAVAGLTGGGAAAWASGATSLAAPILSEIQTAMANGLTKLGIPSDFAENLANFTVGAGVTAIAGSVGGVEAGAMAGNVDFNNRQLHDDEKLALAKFKRGKTKAEQDRLDAAACALVRCSAEFAEGSFEYIEAKQKEEAGWITAQQEILALMDTGLFKYSGRDETWDKVQNKIGRSTRVFDNNGGKQTMAGLKTGLGGAGAITGLMLCSTGFGCIAGFPLALFSSSEFIEGETTLLSMAQNKSKYATGINPLKEGFKKINPEYGALAYEISSLGAGIGEGIIKVPRIVGGTSGIPRFTGMFSSPQINYTRMSDLEKKLYVTGNIFQGNSIRTEVNKVQEQKKK